MDRIHASGRPDDWEDMFGGRAEELAAEGESPPEDWLEAHGGRTSDGTRIVMDGTVQVEQDDTLTTSDL